MTATDSAPTTIIRLPFDSVSGVRPENFDVSTPGFVVTGEEPVDEAIRCMIALCQRRGTGWEPFTEQQFWDFALEESGAIKLPSLPPLVAWKFLVLEGGKYWITEKLVQTCEEAALKPVAASPIIWEPRGYSVQPKDIDLSGQLTGVFHRTAADRVAAVLVNIVQSDGCGWAGVSVTKFVQARRKAGCTTDVANMWGLDEPQGRVPALLVVIDGLIYFTEAFAETCATRHN